MNRPEMGQERPNPSAMMQKALGATDDEWKALQPKVEKVAKLLLESRGAGGMLMLGGLMHRPGAEGGMGPAFGMGRERFGRGPEEFGKGHEEAAEEGAKGEKEAVKGEKETAKGGEEAAEGAEHPLPDVLVKAMELHKLLRSGDAKPQDVQKAVADYRAAHQKVQEDLAKARKDLQASVNPQQEAKLILWGLLE